MVAQTIRHEVRSRGKYMSRSGQFKPGPHWPTYKWSGSVHKIKRHICCGPHPFRITRGLNGLAPGLIMSSIDSILYFSLFWVR